MSILQTDLEKFDNLFEGMNTKPANSQTKVMLESVAVNNGKKVLEEAASKKKKDAKKKSEKDSKKKSSILKAKKNISELSEAFTVANGYVLDTPAKQKFFEAIKSADNCLLEMAQAIGNDFERYYDLYKKYFEKGDLTPEELDFLKQNDPERELDDKLDAFNSNTQSNTPNQSINPNV